MDLYFFFVCFFFLYFFHRFFSKKLISLLIIESLMIFLIFLYVSSFSSAFFSFSIGVLMSCFMVLDSVFGISILICCSRSSCNLNLPILCL